MHGGGRQESDDTIVHMVIWVGADVLLLFVCALELQRVYQRAALRLETSVASMSKEAARHVDTAQRCLSGLRSVSLTKCERTKRKAEGRRLFRSKRFPSTGLIFNKAIRGATKSVKDVPKSTVQA